MIKRPLNARFPDLVLDGTKITTIRDKPWPVGVPIMLYQWSGLPYRSKQIDVCAVEVLETQPIEISNTQDGMTYSVSLVLGRSLWATEGFDSRKEMDDWFRPLVKPGQTVFKHLMRFKLHTP